VKVRDWRDACPADRRTAALTLDLGLQTLDFVKVLIVPDKFKGTLTAADAAEAIACGWCKARPQDQLDLLPMSDGGDGFGEVVSALLRASPQTIKTVDAAHRPCKATWWWEPKTKTAIIESAKIIGLAMLPRGKFHPFELDTFGLGAVLRAAHAKGAKRILIGIGGSATNDGGFGLARASGWKFADRQGNPIERWTELHRLQSVWPPTPRRLPTVNVAVDVQNKLLGLRGATRVYGPQKGIRPEDFDLAERCLGRLASVMRRQFGRDIARVPGTGAAGGLGFGLLAFLGAKLEPGFDLFARLAKLERRLRSADLVITGEGAIDKSTLMGKGVGEIARRCRAARIPCLGLAGTVPRDCRQSKMFFQIRALTDLTSAARAKANPAQWLERLAAEAALEFRLQPAPH
jgi:glycerate kinase